MLMPLSTIVISWRSENHRSVASNWHTFQIKLYRVHLMEFTNLVMIKCQRPFYDCLHIQTLSRCYLFEILKDWDICGFYFTKELFPWSSLFVLPYSKNVCYKELLNKQCITVITKKKDNDGKMGHTPVTHTKDSR